MWCLNAVSHKRRTACLVKKKRFILIFHRQNKKKSNALVRSASVGRCKKTNANKILCIERVVVSYLNNIYFYCALLSSFTQLLYIYSTTIIISSRPVHDPIAQSRVLTVVYYRGVVVVVDHLVKSWRPVALHASLQMADRTAFEHSGLIDRIHPSEVLSLYRRDSRCQPTKKTMPTKSG